MQSHDRKVIPMDVSSRMFTVFISRIKGSNSFTGTMDIITVHVDDLAGRPLSVARIRIE